MPRLSNELKAVVVTEDILETGMSATQDKCMTVQHFSYNSRRKRDYTGAAYGLSDPVLLDFAIRVNSPAHSKPFYSHLADGHNFSLSFVFNAVFSPLKRIADYDDAMVVNGYVVNIIEDFRASAQASDDQQMSLYVKMLVRNITYLGKESNKTITFISNNTEL
jgi:hypothetical protein